MAIKREKVIRAAEKLVSKGKLENAIKQYRKVLAENPNDANTLNRVGDLYARIERFDEAVKLFSQIAEQYTRDGFFVKAIAIYKKIIKLSPQSLQVYERLAELYHKQGLPNEARSQFQILADHYEKRDNATSAVNIYQRMTEIDPDNPSHYLKLAQLYESQQLADKAIRAYRQLADLFLVNGSVEEATQVYLSALDSYSGDQDFVRGVVRGLFDEGHTEAAQKVIAKAKTLHPEAAAIEHEVFSTGEPEPAEPEPAAEPAAAEPAAGASPLPESSGAADVTFDDSAFELPGVPEVSMAEPVASPEPAGAETPASAGFPQPLDQEDDDSVFTLDLDSDEPPASQVTPPPDMMGQAAGEIGDAGPGFEVETREEEAATFEDQEAPEEIDWSIDEGEGEDGLEEVSIELEDEEIEIELEDETAHGTAVALEEAAPEPAAGPAEAPETMARHDDDLLAEAKVFSKYGLREKAEDRLQELLRSHPTHLGGLSLLARLDLEAGRRDDALARAREVARIAAETSVPGTWNELRQDFAKAGFTLEDDEIRPEPEAAAGESDRFAQLLEDLDETAAGLTVVPESEPVEAVALEPEAGAPETEAAPETVTMPAAVELSPELEDDLVTFDLEPPDAEPVVAAPATEAAPADAPAAEEVGKQTIAFDQSFFDAGDQIFDEEPVEASQADAPAAPADPPSAPADASSQEPFAEIEALMQSVTHDAGFEELVPEETSLEELVPLEEAQEGGGAEAPEAAEPRKISLVDELDLGGLEDEEEAVESVAPAAAMPETAEAEAEAPLADLDETGMSWLDEVAPSAAESTAEKESIFDEEDDFFDLAAELEAEMADGDDDAIELETAQEQSLEEIIDGFKRGVAENLSSGDYDTHYNLGIAYREMGLLDEAIGEFQLASKDPRYIVDCSSMLGMCFLEKGLPELAIRWYKKGLESPVVNEEQALGLLYDLAGVYQNQGDTESAYRTFVEIYGMNSNYRDVAHRIQELQQEAPSS